MEALRSGAGRLALRAGGARALRVGAGAAAGAAGSGAGAGAGARGAPPPPPLSRYSLRAEGRGVGTRTVFGTGQVAATDLPRAMGGRDGDPQPVELLLAALVGCEQATAAFAARHMEPRLRLEGIDFAYEAERDPRGATALPLGAPPPAPARLLAVTGVARVRLRAPPGPGLGDGGGGGGGGGAGARAGVAARRAAVQELGAAVQRRCPVAQTLLAAGVQLNIKWELAGDGQ